MAVQKKTGRYLELDGIRGIAALTVFFSHAIGMLPASPLLDALNLSVCHILWDGFAAVDLFFVLSGLCLALPFVGERTQVLDVPGFWIRRVFRIYPAYWFSIVSAMLLQRFCFNPCGLKAFSGWIQSFWHHPLTRSQIIDHIILIGRIDTRLINPVIWSLKVEVRVSLLFPLMIMVVRRISSLRGAFLLMLSSYVAGYALLRFTGLDSFLYLPLFAMGALIARFYTAIVRWSAGIRRSSLWLFGILAILLYTARSILPWLNPTVGDTLVGLGSVLIIVLTLGQSALSRFFTWKPVFFLGRISYSFYLIHFPLLLSISSLLGGHLPWLLFASISLAVTLVVAWGMFCAIELPFQKFGRHASEFFFRQREALGLVKG